jgi:glycosyltransferase involved in cell wall biosynthesis
MSLSLPNADALPPDSHDFSSTFADVKLPVCFNVAHLEQQIHALDRIYRLLYPQSRITYLVGALPNPTGAPERVRVDVNSAISMDVKGDRDMAAFRAAAVAPHLGETYLGTLSSGPIDAAHHVTIAADLVGQVDEKAPHDDATSLVFSRRAIAVAAHRFPVLFEQAKHLYEERSRRIRLDRHEHRPLQRVSDAPFGELIGRTGGQKPAILIGFHWLEMGGAEALAFDTVTWALDAGFRVFVIGDQPAPQRLADQLPDHPDLEFLRPDAYLPNGLWTEFLISLIRHENIVAMHIHHHIRLYDNLMKIKSLFPDLAVIDSTHIVEHRDGGFVRTSGVWSNYIDVHHTISRDLNKYLLDHFGVARRTHLGRMLRPATADDTPPPPARLMAGQPMLRLAFVGRMVHQKRGVLAIALMQRLQKWSRKAGVEVHLDVVGTGAYLDLVRDMVAQNRLGDQVTFHGPGSDVPALLEKSDILLIASANEGLALVGYEAVRAGALPISSDVGGQSELIAPELLLPKSPRAFLRAAEKLIQRLHCDPDFLKSAKDATLEKYQALGKDPTAQGVLSGIYRDILSKAKSK